MRRMIQRARVGGEHPGLALEVEALLVDGIGLLGLPEQCCVLLGLGPFDGRIRGQLFFHGIYFRKHQLYSRIFISQCIC